MRYASFNSICPYFKRETEGRCSFAVSATRLWNNVSLNIRKSDSIKSLIAHLFKTIKRLKSPFSDLTFIFVCMYILWKFLILL